MLGSTQRLSEQDEEEKEQIVFDTQTKESFL